MRGRRTLAIAAVLLVATLGGAALAMWQPSPSMPIAAEPTTPLASEPTAPLAANARIAPGGFKADPRQLVLVPEVRVARIAMDSPVHAEAGGAVLRDGEGNNLVLWHGLDVAVIDGPRQVNGDEWFLVYALADPNTGPTEYAGWVRLTVVDGIASLALTEPQACPGELTIAALAVLDPFTRAACIGKATVTLQGWTWRRVLPTWYRIQPAWFGEQNGVLDSTFSLHGDPFHRGANGGPGRKDFLELQLPPGLDAPPYEFEVQVTAHVADPRGADCRRVRDQFGMVPEDVPQRGPLWCATRLVVESWTPILGPEGRVIDRAAPQLHRHADAGANAACAGVGMGPLVFRLDPNELDPVWLETVELPAGQRGHRIIPDFDPGFRAVFAPDLQIVDERGQVVARDGTPVDPDGALAGHSICPTGLVVYFN